METNAVMDIMWILICGILVFFMQAGFTLVETGFTRSKNAGNIIMKNLMDFCIGSIAFWVLGYSLMYGESISGIIGTPSLLIVRKKCIVCFFKLYLQQLPQQLFLELSLKEQNLLLI
jgi:ammonia channel protein AmtB